MCLSVCVCVCVSNRACPVLLTSGTILHCDMRKCPQRAARDRQSDGGKEKANRGTGIVRNTKI